MGGYIKVIIRFNDGTVHADTYGTNALPFWVCHPKTMMGDESTMRRYIETCTKWNDGDSTYTPSEYGVFAIDFQTKTMLSANDYSHCDSYIMDQVRMMAQRFGAETPSGEDENGYTIFDEMLYRGFAHVTKRQINDRRSSQRPPLERIEIPGIRANEWDEKVCEVYNKLRREEEDRRFSNLPDWGSPSYFETIERLKTEPEYVYEVGFDYPGWTRHCETDRGVDAQERLRIRLRELGFPITDADEAAFVKWRNERREWEREEEEEEEDYDDE